MRHMLFLFSQWLIRDLAGRYRGAWLGMAWPALQPIGQVAIFTLIFFEFMRMRWPSLITGQPESHSAWVYALNVLGGLAVFNFFAEVLGRAPGAILAQTNLVTKVKFPLVILPFVTASSALVHILAGGVALWLAGAWTLGFSNEFWAVPLWFFLWLTPVMLYGLGAALFLSALGVYVRDIQQVMPAIISLVMFLTPIFYPLSAVPAGLQEWFALNPIAWAAESLRAITLGQTGIDFNKWAGQLFLATAVFGFGWLSFKTLRDGFADVL